MSGWDDDEWTGGVPPEGHHTREQARPEFWLRQRPPQVALGALALLLIVLAVVVLTR